MQIAARLAVQSPAQDQRRAQRKTVSVAADMRLLGYHGFDVVVRDISELGFKVESPVKVASGSIVRLRLPGLGMLLGKIIWARSGHLGGEFINPVSPSRLRLVLGYAPASSAQLSSV
jgi:PilZ domain